MDYLSNQVDYIFMSMYKKYPTLISEIREKIYTVADTGISSRNINTLDKLGLLSETRVSKKKWRKFNLNDLLYLYTLSQCKKFKTSSDILGNIRDVFYNENVNYKLAGPVTTSEKALMVMLTESVPMGIKIYANGTVIISDIQKVNLNLISKNPAIFIDLYTLFQDRIKTFKNTATFKNRYDLDCFEDGYPLRPIKTVNVKLLNFLQEQKYSKITITKKPNGKIDVEGEIIEHTPHLTPMEFYELVEGVGYGNVELSIKDGVSQHARLKKHHKF